MSLAIANQTAAAVSPVNRFDTRCRPGFFRGPRAALYSAPATQTAMVAPQQVATPTTTSVWTCEPVTDSP
jgi:hypothetical protein